MFILFYLLLLSTNVFLGTFAYVPNQRMNPMLIYENYAYNKCKPKPSDDGNICDRCVYYQTKGIKCHSSCAIRKPPNWEDIMVRGPKTQVGHGKYNEAKKYFKKAIAEINVRCLESNQNFGKIQPQRVFNKVIEIHKKSSNVKLTNEVTKEM